MLEEGLCEFCGNRPKYGCIWCNPQYLSNNRINRFGCEKTIMVWSKTYGHCWYCGVYMTPPAEGKHVSADYKRKMFSMEHIKPVSKIQDKEYKNSVHNLLPACSRCNNLRGNLSIEYLRMRLGFKRKWPDFNPEQFQFLFNRGINLGKLTKYKFYFEMKGLKG